MASGRGGIASSAWMAPGRAARWISITPICFGSVCEVSFALFFKIDLGMVAALLSSLCRRSGQGHSETLRGREGIDGGMYAAVAPHRCFSACGCCDSFVRLQRLINALHRRGRLVDAQRTRQHQDMYGSLLHICPLVGCRGPVERAPTPLGKPPKLCERALGLRYAPTPHRARPSRDALVSSETSSLETCGSKAGCGLVRRRRHQMII